MTKKVPTILSGFTLIELLVVIAIIGLLSSVVLASLRTARDKGADAGAKSYVSNARAEAELYFDNASPNSYDGVCGNSGGYSIGDNVNAAERAYSGGTATSVYTDSGTTPAYNIAQCHDSSSGWAAWVPLRSSTSAAPKGWCVDNAGTAKLSSALLPVNVTVCP